AVVLVAATPFLIGSQAIPLLATLKVRDSQAAVQRGDGEDALVDALAARKIQPWAASTNLQVALVQEQIGDLAAAHTAIRDAIDRDGSNWRLWMTAARIETKLGAIEDARRSLRRAAELNPRSPLFAGVPAAEE
ncbi:MAG TPA: tetratricopeptide repeat protein, partial [Gaiellaceae bacterium]|nr:tetratricopeptide repeat protein [Gaiellaceae bacterium]